ncbi:MAG: right-handed parallel beta-helix repeat-containing protein [Thermoproteota archaeon]|nr:right-handed parallel beta-helix repeat-containing protein [Thermoproteota archaeon]
MVATIVSFAVIGGLIMQPISSMAQGQQAQQEEEDVNQVQTQDQRQGQQDNQAQRGDQQDTRTPTTTAACGQVVEGLVELNSNLNCSGDGLIVGGDDTTIRLNGHTIMGPGPDSSKVGVSVGNQDGVRIEGPGTIEQFQAGILASGAEGTMISEMILEDNQIAIFSTGTEGLQAMQNIITRNSIGMASHSSNGLELRENLLTGNVLAGITFVATGESLVSTNNVIESENGIFVDPQSSDNRIESNNVLRNKVDLNNANGLATNVNQNGYSDNNCQISNPSGLCIGR